MDKDKILEAARKNKSRGKEYEKKESIRSGLVGTLVALTVGIALFLVEYLVANSVNVGMIAVGMTACGVQSLYEGVMLKKSYLILMGVIQSAIAILAIVLFVVKAI